METKLVKFNPEKDTQNAKQAADQLIDIVKKNKWSINVGGKSDHLMYEAWQTVGKYFNVSVGTGEAEPVTIGSISGFKAKAWVIDNKTGFKIGEAEAYCMRDEGNWRIKPTFQLASMAQTRAGSKALRQIFGFVVALAGYNPTPAEEMVYEPKHEEKPVLAQPSAPQTISTEKPTFINASQKMDILALLGKKGKTVKDLDKVVESRGKKFLKELTAQEADAIIKKLESMPDIKEEHEATVSK